MQFELVSFDCLMDLDAAESMRRTLCDALLTGRDIELDASRVTEMTFGAMQVVVAGVQAANAAGVQIRVGADPAPVVAKSFASAGFDIAALATTCSNSSSRGMSS